MQKILVIDDDELHLMLMRNVLEREGYDVFSTADGPQGITMYKERRPALVLLDLGLPSMSGLDVLKEVRGFDDKAKVVVLSGYGASESIAVALRYGASGFIDKSVHMEVLLEKIRNLLENDAT
jgi:DNA-binding response OmpR family regulator